MRVWGVALLASLQEFPQHMSVHRAQPSITSCLHSLTYPPFLGFRSSGRYSDSCGSVRSTSYGACDVLCHSTLPQN